MDGWKLDVVWNTMSDWTVKGKANIVKPYRLVFHSFYWLDCFWSIMTIIAWMECIIIIQIKFNTSPKIYIFIFGCNASTVYILYLVETTASIELSTHYQPLNNLNKASLHHIKTLREENFYNNFAKTCSFIHCCESFVIRVHQLPTCLSTEFPHKEYVERFASDC